MTTRLCISLAIGSLLVGLVLAGTLDPPGPPAPSMVTLQQIYDRAHPVDTCFNNVGRFADCGNGTVKDNLTGLFWLKDANCFGLKDWAAANIAAAQLANGQCGLTDGSVAGTWRLPTQAEWQGIVNSSCYPSPGGPTIPDMSGGGCYATGTQWASGLQSDRYWSSTTYAIAPNNAWSAILSNGIVNPNFKAGTGAYVWPVRGGP
jgi:hypothetical protein